VFGSPVIIVDFFFLFSLHGRQVFLILWPLTCVLIFKVGFFLVHNMFSSLLIVVESILIVSVFYLVYFDHS
jgi:hypothetical protein